MVKRKSILRRRRGEIGRFFTSGYNFCRNPLKKFVFFSNKLFFSASFDRNRNWKLPLSSVSFPPPQNLSHPVPKSTKKICEKKFHDPRKFHDRGLFVVFSWNFSWIFSTFVECLCPCFLAVVVV